MIGGSYGRGDQQEMKGCFHYRNRLRDIQKEYPRMWMEARRIWNQAKKRIIKGGNGQLCQKAANRSRKLQSVNCLRFDNKDVIEKHNRKICVERGMRIGRE